jgi:hypothetical protein
MTNKLNAAKDKLKRGSVSQWQALTAKTFLIH